MGKFKKKIPELGDLLSLRKENKQIHDFILGHVMIETLLVQLIDTKLKYPDKFDTFKLSFPKKVDLCVALWLLKEKGANFLKTLNKERNKFAHNLNHKLTFDEIFKLIEFAGQSGVEFTDGVDNDIKFAKENYDEESLIRRLFDNICKDISDVVHKNGGEYCFKNTFQ